MSDQMIDGSKLPIRRPPFRGTVKRTLDGSEPDWNYVAPGLVVGLFAPPLLAATAVGAVAGAAVGKFAKHRVESGIAEKMDAALSNGTGGVIAVYDSDGADAVDKALTNAVKKSVAHIDGMSAKGLKAGLAEAQSGMGGS